MIDKQKILEKMKGKPKSKQFLLEDTGEVIGSEVDENNQLFYVIDRGGDLSIEKATNKKIKERFFTHQPKTITLDNGVITIH